MKYEPRGRKLYYEYFQRKPESSPHRHGCSKFIHQMVSGTSNWLRRCQAYVSFHFDWLLPLGRCERETDLCRHAAKRVIRVRDGAGRVGASFRGAEIVRVPCGRCPNLCVQAKRRSTEGAKFRLGL